MIHVGNLKKGRVLSMFFQDESSWLLPKWLNEEKLLTTILFRDLTSRLTHGNTSQVFKAQPDNGVSLVLDLPFRVTERMTLISVSSR
jgi:hypothetical protein